MDLAQFHGGEGMEMFVLEAEHEAASSYIFKLETDPAG